MTLTCKVLIITYTTMSEYTSAGLTLDLNVQHTTQPCLNLTTWNTHPMPIRTPRNLTPHSPCPCEHLTTWNTRPMALWIPHNLKHLPYASVNTSQLETPAPCLCEHLITWNTCSMPLWTHHNLKHPPHASVNTSQLETPAPCPCPHWPCAQINCQC